MREAIAGVLWIGNSADVRDIKRILDLEIAAVVAVAAEEPPTLLPRDLVYCRFPLVDGGESDPAVLQAAIATTAGFIASKKRALIACSGGMSRSPAIAAAALARIEHLPLDRALQRVASNGPHDVSPAFWADIRNVGQ